jgi:hypothetical protein
LELNASGKQAFIEKVKLAMDGGLGGSASQDWNVVESKRPDLGQHAVVHESWLHALASIVESRRDPGFTQDDDHPVVNVSWFDAQAYVHWLREETRRRGHTNPRLYRLLSEAEWEYCCRAGTTSDFSTGQTITAAQANFGTSGGTTSVLKFPPNPWGLCDMHGNAWEWVEDCFHSGYDGAPSDGSAWTTGDCRRRGARGGSWATGASDSFHLQSDYRVEYSPVVRNAALGFRVARDLTALEYVPVFELADDSNAAANLVRDGKLDDAETAAQDLIARFPHQYDGWDRLGMVHEARGQNRQAADCYRKAIETIRQQRDYDWKIEIDDALTRLVAKLDPT